jgi:hypothetical protein
VFKLDILKTVITFTIEEEKPERANIIERRISHGKDNRN